MAIAAVVIVRFLPKRSSAGASVTTEAVERRDIAVTVEATGTVEPINLVEVKSKASGQIVRMPVEIGSVVQPGDLLVQVDPRDVQNAFDQSQAALVAAEARARVSANQRQRADELFAAQVITATEHETSTLDEANAKSALVAARTNLDLARQRLEDATVRAPIAGTVLEKPVSVGQVISSATSSVTGGTTLLQMADLSRIRMRALVVETDIGKVHEGQNVAVVVDAYPQRSFHGVVEKIEPQAVVQQSVTMFPVLISISNDERLLLPGMNGEVTMTVDQRRNVLAAPLDALRSLREITPLASALGIDVDSLRAQMRGGATGAAAASRAQGDSVRPRSARAAGDSVASRRSWSRGTGPAGEGMTPERVARMRARMASGDMDPEQLARMRERMAAAGVSAGGAPGTPAAGAGGSGAGSGTGAASGSGMKVVVVKTATGLAARVVQTGLSDYDYAEVVRGLEEGDQVVMLGVFEAQQQRNQMTSRIRERAGAGLTGGSSSSSSRTGSSSSSGASRTGAGR